MSEARRQASGSVPSLAAAAPRRAIKNPNWLFETQNHARTDDCVLEDASEGAALDASSCFRSRLPLRLCPVPLGQRVNQTAAEITFLRAMWA